MNRFSALALATTAVALTSLLTSACGGSAPPAEAAEPAAGTAGRPVPITLAPGQERDVPLTIQATGAFVADEESDVAPEIAGLVASTPVDVGDRVAAGAVLARLSTADAELRLAQARAGLQQAEAAAAQARSATTWRAPTRPATPRSSKPATSRARCRSRRPPRPRPRGRRWRRPRR